MVVLKPGCAVSDIAGMPSIEEPSIDRYDPRALAAQAKENLRTLRCLAVIAGEEKRRTNPKEHLRTLRRRHDYLDSLITEKRASEGALAYHRAERGALAWALDKLEAVHAAERPAKTG